MQYEQGGPETTHKTPFHNTSDPALLPGWCTFSVSTEQQDYTAAATLVHSYLSALRELLYTLRCSVSVATCAKDFPWDCANASSCL